MSGLRSSARNTTRKRYTVDAFDGIDGLQDDESPPAEESASSGSEAVVDDGEDDDDAEDGSPRVDEDGNDEMSGVEHDVIADDDIDDSSRPTTKSKAGQTPMPRKSTQKKSKKQQKSKQKSSRKSTAGVTEDAIPEEDDQEKIYIRGYPSRLSHSKGAHRLYFFGPTTADWGLPVEVHRRFAIQPCLPTRSVNASGIGGFFVSAPRQKEIDAAEERWSWWGNNGGRQWFARAQIGEDLGESLDGMKSYLPIDGDGRRTFLMGPLTQPIVFCLEAGEVVPLRDAFPPDKAPKPKEEKSGFVLNLGAKVHCLDWAPNQSGPKQYLAVAVLPARPEDDPSVNIPAARALKPQPAYKSSIQIWEFAVDKGNGIDTNISPRRKLVLGMDFGDVKVLKWCPMPNQDPSLLGLLACIHGDGTVRIYHVARPDDSATDSFILIGQPAFTATAPSTVYTCIAWISPTQIAAGCANGCLAIWDLSTYASTPTTRHPRPIAYVSISATYILALTTCYPSFSHLLISTSMSGYTQITDLRGPANQLADPAHTVPAPRSRLGTPWLTYSDLLRSALVVEDNGSACTFKAMPLRMFFTSVGFGRETNSAAAIAVSPVHPFMLVGTAEGSVVGVNPTARAVAGGKSEIWQQKWLAHEWRRPTAEEQQSAVDEHEHVPSPEYVASAASQHSGQPKDALVVRQSIATSGLSRITEGYKADRVYLSGGDEANTKDGVSFATIHEERTAVSALAWNPNLHVAGWAAAGFADGLLRVEDIAT